MRLQTCDAPLSPPEPLLREPRGAGLAAARLAWFVLCSCSSGLGASAAPEPSFSIPSAENASRPAAHVAELQRLLRGIHERRGLELARTPRLLELSRPELVAEAMRVIRATTPERLNATYARLLVSLELAPRDFDYMREVERALSADLRAFYAPEQDTLFVERALPASAREHAIVHELLHALQNQHFGVAASLADPLAEWDQKSVVHSLAEGDAEAFVARWLAPGELDSNLSEPTTNEVERDPVLGVLSRSWQALYLDGREAVERAHAVGGWNAVDALLSRPPASTHELLHPERAAAPRASELPVPPSDAGQWRLAHSDVLGEQTLRSVLEEWWPQTRARAVASAWSGDRLTWFEAGPATALVWQLRFDSVEAAVGAAEAFSTGLALASPKGADVSAGARSRAAPGSAKPLVCRPHRDNGVLGISSQVVQLDLLAMHGLSPEAGCRELSEWSSRLPRAAAPPRPGSKDTHRSP